MYSVGERIAKLRKQRGMTQEQLAELVQCSVQTEDGWESGGAEPDLQTLLRLADIVGVSADELLGRRGVPYVSPAPAPYAGAVPPAQSAAAPAQPAAPPAGCADAEEKKSARMKRALFILVIVWSGAYFCAQLFGQFDSSSLAMLAFTLVFESAAKVAAVAAAVMFIFDKAPTASVTSRILFFGGVGLALCASAVFPILAQRSRFDYIGLKLIVLGGGLMALYGACFSFRADQRLWALRIPACIVASVGAVCAAFGYFFPERWLHWFNTVWSFFYAGLPWCLLYASAGRERGRDYAAENAARRRAWWGKHRGIVLPAAFIACFAVMLGIYTLVFTGINASMIRGEGIPYLAPFCNLMICILPPIVFCLYFWLLKSDERSKTSHWLSFALWAACFLLAGNLHYTDWFVLREPPLWLLILENAFILAAMFGLFLWTLFLFPDKRAGACRLAVRIVFGILAGVVPAVGLGFVLANSIGGGTMFYVWSYCILLFALSFFKKDRTKRN